MPDPTDGDASSTTSVMTSGVVGMTTSQGDGTDDATTSAESGGCVLGTIGCECGPGCTAGLMCEGDVCISADCGNGALDPGEACDDGNLEDGDGCEATCSVTEGIARVVTGDAHTCARAWDGSAKCWGDASDGRLGYGMGANADIGDDEPAGDAPLLMLGGAVRSMCAAAAHTCALLEDGRVRCWGRASEGRLGNMASSSIGAAEPALDSPPVEIGGMAQQLDCSGAHSCALRSDGALFCWGDGGEGRLGLVMANDNIGDNETPQSAGPVDVGGQIADIAVGGGHTCVLLQDGAVRCWGRGAEGQLGYGNGNNIGDDETPASAGDVMLGEPAVELAAGGSHTCVRLQSGLVKCWGYNATGQLGDGTTENRGNDANEIPTMLAPLATGEQVMHVEAGLAHTCVVLTSGAVKCWGAGADGRLASEATDTVLEPPAASTQVDAVLGATLVELGAGHTCARLTDGSLRCWGDNAVGQRGYGNTDDFGDEPGETLVSLSPVPL